MPGFKAEPGVTADGTGTTAFPGPETLRPAPLLNAVVTVASAR